MSIIRDLKENEYESYQLLIDKTMDNIEELVDPVLISFKDELALVCYLSGFYSIATPTENVLIRKTEDGKLCDLVNDNYHYQVHLESDIPIVSKVNNYTNDLEQLFLTPAKENEPRSYMHYYQGKAYGNGDELEMDFDLHNFENRINQFLCFSSNRKADIMTLRLLKQFLIFNYKKNKSICYSDEERMFLECIQSKLGYIRLFGLGKKYDFKELQEYISSLGFNPEMNKELVELFMGSHKGFNEFEALSNKYDEFKKVR